MAAIDKVKQARGLPPSAPATPSPSLSQPPASQAEFRELLALLRSLEGQMKAWPQAIGEETTRVLRADKQETKEFQKTEAAAWHHERGEWVGQTLEALGRGQAIAKSHEAQNTRQEKLIERQEKQQEVWILGMSRERLKALGGALGLFLFGAIFGGIIYLQVGPMSQIGAALRKAETNLSTYRQLWATATEAEQKRIRKRLEDKTAGK